MILKPTSQARCGGRTSSNFLISGGIMTSRRLSFVLFTFLFTIGMLFADTSASRLLASDYADVTAADLAWTSALAKGDRAAVEKLADTEFTWTDRTGKTRARADVLSTLAVLTSDPDSDVSSMNEKTVALVRGIHRIPSQNVSVRFVRVWVLRPVGWKLIVYQETTKAE